MSKIATIINFCTYDLPYLDRCISAVTPFSDQILLPVCDHLFDGTPEDLSLLGRIYKKYPRIDFIEFAYSETEVYGTPSKLVPKSPWWARHWHNSARLIGTYFLRKEIDYLLFVDVDEIFEGDVREIPFHEYAALRFATYWYFKSASRRATVTPDGPLLIAREQVDTERLLNEYERTGLFLLANGRKEREFLWEAKPLVHHYSWVRGERELVQKVRAWGHNWERKWEEQIHGSEDFVRGYTYEEVEPFWDPLEETVILPSGRAEPLARVTPKEIFRKEIAQTLRLL
jgi:hypothetical protein